MSPQKVAIVTGANKGLGFAIVKKLCSKYEGLVYLTARNENRGVQAIEELKKSNLHPTFHKLDVSYQRSISDFAEHIRNKQIEILINNAGILFLKDAKEPLCYQAEQTILINFFGLVNFCETVIPYVKNGGKIVNISSSSGHLSRLPSEELRNKFSSEDLTLDELKELMQSYVEAVKRGDDLKDTWGDSSYVVSKVGVNAYTFNLHRRLSPKGITVNCVHPGYVISDMTRGVGNVTPEDAAEVPLKLALQPEGSGLFVWHNGTPVPWDGPDPRGYIDGKS
ncbi:hypothetical protein O3G_MSEX006673 [Manduca sexta]|uniref:Uncharacterized protein n=1 Tax=Manduca sexta TaxID=7130 RepID=A0A922CM84_MANSE|nr:hypothetical protein O3G_MSEX006673 [Manduca sexta]